MYLNQRGFRWEGLKLERVLQPKCENAVELQAIYQK
jgi:hypothetical protein